MITQGFTPTHYYTNTHDDTTCMHINATPLTHNHHASIVHVICHDSAEVPIGCCKVEACGHHVDHSYTLCQLVSTLTLDSIEPHQHHPPPNSATETSCALTTWSLAFFQKPSSTSSGVHQGLPLMVQGCLMKPPTGSPTLDFSFTHST